MLLFYANFGYEPRDFTGISKVITDNPIVALIAAELRDMHTNLHLELMFYC